MANLVLDDQREGISRTLSDSPPTHFTIKIESFSMLAKNNVETYESGSFEAGGYRWKLILHPNGNKKRNVREHLSVYLSMAETPALQPGWGVYAVFRLFLLDQNKDDYLVVEEANQTERRFHGMKKEWGFDKFIPARVFSDVSNGYLVDDACVLGAEVFVRKEKGPGKGECLSMMKDAISYKHVWKSENFSKINAECDESKEFHAGNYKWKIQVYPKGRRHGADTHLSLYLALADLPSIPPESKILVNLILRVLDQMQARHLSGTATQWFSASSPECGWARYCLLSTFKHPSRGFLVKDTCQMEAEVTVLGVSSALP